MNTELQFIRDKLKDAHNPEEVFGIIDGDSTKQIKTIRSIYRNLAKATHEDLFPEIDKPLARETFVVLGDWWNQAQNKINNKTYGNISISGKTKPLMNHLS